MRKRPPTTRCSITHKFEIRGRDELVEGYITVGRSEDGAPVEIFLIIAKAGETLRGIARCWGMSMSWCLQNGVPMSQIVERYKFQRFEPAGLTGNPDIEIAQSIADYVARWLEITFPSVPEIPSLPESPLPTGRIRHHGG